MEQTLSVAAVAETMIAHRRRLFIGFALGYGTVGRQSGHR